jgi:hypothetical protein
VSSLLRQLREDALDRGAVSDQSLRRKADDQLGYTVYVEALHAFICSQDTTTPLTIGIDGAWGSGKTSLMRMVQSELDGPPSFSTRLAQAWARLIWFVKFCLALPLWLLGAALMRFNGGSQDQPRWPNIRAGCSFDPSLHDRAAIGDWPRSARFWATIATWRQPQDAPFHPTIWFNAWKFDQEEQLWAALAVEALRQIKRRYGPIGRFIFWLRLTWRRFTPLVALFAILQRIAIPLVLAVLAVLFDVYLKQLPSQAAGSAPRTPQWLLDTLLLLGQPLLLGGALITGAIQIAKIVKDPFQLSVNDLLRKPDYEAKVGFLGAFEADFAHIVAVATRRHQGWKPQKLVIFIDDLDRCEPPKSVDVIEAINLHVYIASKLGLFEEQTIAEQCYGRTLNRLAVWVAWSIRWTDLAKHLLYEAQLQRSWLRDFLASLAEFLHADESWLALSDAQQRQIRFAKPIAEAGEDHTAPENLYQAIVAWVVADRSRSADHAPWLLLPWEWWLMKRDFLQGVKSMESFWRRPDGVSVDWFKTTLLMTRVDFEALAPVEQ